MMDDFNNDNSKRPDDPFSREPIKTTYPGRSVIGGGPPPTRRFILFGAVAAVSLVAGLAVFLINAAKGGDGQSESPTPGTQTVPPETPVAGERDSRPGQAPIAGLDAPDPEHGILGSTSVSVEVLSVSGGGRDREAARVEKALKSSYRGVATAYMDYCRRRGVAEGRDEITLRFRVAPAGAVNEVEVLSNSTADEEVAAAARDAAIAAQFPPCGEEAFVTCKYYFKARMAPEAEGK